ncbi:MAG: hypothetical protein ABEI52_06970, partial [Halobacteriaceae archaeon]
MDGLQIAVTTCYDLRFPEQFRSLLERGAECYGMSRRKTSPFRAGIR